MKADKPGAEPKPESADRPADREPFDLSLFAAQVRKEVAELEARGGKSQNPDL